MLFIEYKEAIEQADTKERLKELEHQALLDDSLSLRPRSILVAMAIRKQEEIIKGEA